MWTGDKPQVSFCALKEERRNLQNNHYRYTQLKSRLGFWMWRLIRTEIVSTLHLNDINYLRGNTVFPGV